MQKIVIYILIFCVVGLGISVFVQRCVIKKQVKEIKHLKIDISNYKYEIDFAKWYIETIEMLSKITERKINEINKADKKKLVDIGNELFNFGVYKVRNTAEKNTDTQKAGVRKNK